MGFELGKKQKLIVGKIVDFGVYLVNEKGAEDKVLLPSKQVPDGAKLGDEIEAFIYRDSSDRLIATTNTPLLTLGEVARLEVAQTTKVGAFLNWGLEKDLFLPFKEQTRRVAVGESVLVALYVDKSSRLCATMKVYPYLKSDSKYGKDDRVSGEVYEISKNFGAFVAVDDKYSALIPKKELFGSVNVGDRVIARVVSVKEDGKINLSIREKAYLAIDDDAERIMEVIESFDGVLPFTDKASPETINRETGMSKNEFKRAVGRLYKERRILIEEKCIRKVQ